MPDFHGTRWLKGGQIVTPNVLYTEKRAWETSLQQLHSGITSPGIVNARQNLLLRYNDSNTFILTSGVAYTKAIKDETIGAITYRKTEYLRIRVLQDSVPDSDTELPTSAYFPNESGVVVKKDSGELPLVVPVSATSPGYPIFKDTLGNSLLLGSLSEPNVVLIVYKEQSASPTITVSGTIVQSEAIEGAAVAVVTMRDHTTLLETGSNASIPGFLKDAILSNRCVPIGLLYPINGGLKEDSIYVLGSYLHTLPSLGWPYQTVRPEHSLIDVQLRTDTKVKDAVLESFPSRFVVRRTYNVGASWSSSETRFGDIYTETDVKMVTDVDGSYTGLPNSFFLTRGSDSAGGPFRGLTHFPYKILAIIGSNGKNYTTFAKIVPYKRYLSVGDARGIPANITFTVTYGWVNNCEPNLDETTTPNRVVIHQPLEKEMVAIGTRAFQTLPCSIATLDFQAHFPGEKIFYLDRSGYTRQKPNILVPVNTISGLASLGKIYPTKQPTTPAHIQIWVTNDSSSTGASATLAVTGYTDGGILATEVIQVSSSSRHEVRPGLGTGGGDWVGFYAETKNFYSFVRSVQVSGASSSYYGIITSSEGVDIGRELPVFSFVVDSSGAYKLNTFKDLRQTNISQNMSSENQETSIVHTGGTITVTVTAGESLVRGDIVYIKHSDGKAYNAIAQNDALPVDDLDQVQVLGVVYPRDIPVGTSGEVLCRGVFGLAETDTMYSVYGGLTPGVIVLSKSDKGYPQDLMDLISYIRNGDKDFVPVVRVIEAFGSVLDVTPPDVTYPGGS